VSSEVASPRMTSTSFMTGTGFMKCMPITFSGRPVWAAMRPMGMEEVLVARMDLRPGSVHRDPKDGEFEVFVFGGRFHHEIGGRHVV
jgi:hypothetical protein